jgi:hypothetical protein
LIPSQYAKSIFHINYELLWIWGYRLLIFDADNTLLRHWENELSDETRQLLLRLKKKGFKIVIVSNTVIASKSERVRAITQSVGIRCVCCERKRQRKPLPWGINEAMSITRIHYRKTVVIGDQVCRDIKAANAAKAHYSILVDPISWHPFWQYLIFPHHRICDWWIRKRQWRR